MRTLAACVAVVVATLSPDVQPAAPAPAPACCVVSSRSSAAASPSAVTGSPETPRRLGPTALPEAGTLAISVPPTAVLGATSPGNTTQGALGTVAVSDTRTAVGTWTATVTGTPFSTGGGTTAETIPLTAIRYWSGPATATSGTGVATPGQLTSAQAQTLTTARVAFGLTAGVGNTSVSWRPTLVVAVPSGAVAGAYQAVVTHSVA